MDKIQIMTRELGALGQYYRNDWSNFDGRTLRSQLDRISSWLKNDSKDQEEFTDFTEMLKEQDEEMF